MKHARAKQRSDKKETSFLVPQKYGEIVLRYLSVIKADLGKTDGRVFWTGRGNKFINQPLGKNCVSNVAHDVAAVLNLDDAKNYSFHSFRRSSVTQAADQGASAQQLVDFYGWKSASMAQEYISTSKAALQNIAEKLSTSEVGENLQEDAVQNHCQGNSDPVCNFDLGEPDVSEFAPMFSNSKLVFTSATKVVIINKVENLNL